MSSNEILRLENVSKFYKTANNVALGIRKVNASFKMGEFVVITGASGSGKSTLLNVLSGMTSYEEGVMYINGEDSSYFGQKEYENYRKDYIACIFQNYNIIDSYSVYENIELALIARGVKKEERKPIILDVAKKVGIENRLRNKVTKLSGGEKQRVAIARALVSDAPILVCDEITGNLDHDTSIEIVKLLHSLSQDKLVLMVTHDPEEVMQYATRVISMYDGTIQSDKTLKEINYDEEVKIKDTTPIQKAEIFKIAWKSFKNTPRKSLLLVLILLLSTIFIGFACATVTVNNDLDLDLDFYFGDTNYDKRRIVVKRQDGANLNDADYTYFKNINDVNYVYNNNLVIDKPIYVQYINYDANIYFSSYCNIYNNKMLKDKDITIGRLPNNKDEIVIEASEKNYSELRSVLDKEFTCGTDAVSFKAKLVGIIISDNSYSSKVYIDDELFTKLDETRRINTESFRLSSTYLYNDYFFVSDVLPNNSVNVYYNYELYGENSTLTNINYQKNGEEKVINDVNLKISQVTTFSDVALDSGVDFGNYFNNMDEYFYNALVISRDIYDIVAKEEFSETSIYVEDPKDASIVQKTLNDNGYIAIVAYYERGNATGDVLGAILSIFRYIFCIALAFVIYLLSFLSLKNVIYSERKDLLIMRSLGFGIKQVSKQIYIKLVGLSIVMTILFIATSLVLHMFYFPSTHALYAIARMGVISYIYMSVLVIGMTYLLSRKFVKNIFKANIASKDKEELQ